MYQIVIFGDMPDLETYSRSSGAHRIATELRDHGYSVLVVDFSNYINYNAFSKLIDLATDENTLAVGFSTTWFPFILPNGSMSQREPSKPSSRFNSLAENQENYLSSDFGGPNTQKYFDKIKSANQNIKIILGGAKAYLYTNLKGVDNVFIGHSETMIIDYLKSTEKDWPKVIDYDKKAQNKSWDFRKSRIDYMPEAFILPSETLLLEIGRGCRFNCKFCSFPLIGQKNISDYLKYEECLYQELLDNWNRFGTWKYTIVDDTFNDSTEKLEMVKRVVDRLPFTPAFWCYLRLDLIAVYREHIQLIKDIGIREVYFGIETLNREAGKVIGKGIDPTRIIDTLEECAKVWGNDIVINTGLICGLPKDTIENFEKSCEYFNRPDRPVNHINTTPLRIIKNIEHTKYRFNAAFELEAEKYGYEFPYNDVPWRWVKKDGTDIDTFEKATELAVKWQKQLDSHIEFRREFFYVSCINLEKYNYNKLMSLLSKEEFYSYFDGEDIKEQMKNQIEQCYFRPLLEFLESKRNL